MKKNKLLIPIMVLILVIGVVGGTLAWLTDQTAEVENTFTVGNIDIDLTEDGATVDPTDANLFKQNFKMVPGAEIAKKPEVTVKKDSEKCWVFVKVTESNVLDNYISYDICDPWKPISTGSNVYYYIQDATDVDVVKSVLKEDKVTVLNTVTKDNMDALKVTGATQPTLSFKAYAIQYDNLTDAEGNPVTVAADAWDLVSGE